MQTRYFVRRDESEPFYVFRILPGMRVQVYDVAGHAWLPTPLHPLYKWAIADPDMGVDEIDKARAQQIIDWFHRRPAPPIPRTAAELLDELGVSEEPIDRQRKAVYKWLESHDLPDALRHDLARRGLVGPLVGDVPQFRLLE
jgi:hypothetical protein